MKPLIQKLQDYSRHTLSTIEFTPGGRIDVDGVDVTVERLAGLMGAPANDNCTSEGFAVTMDAMGYSSLARVLGRAFEQAARGKGKERHAGELPFDQQPMQTLCCLYGVGFALGQAAKKTQEAQRLPRDRAVAELLGAINYLAGAVIFLESQPQAQVAHHHV